jgi:HEPN domain-containing protein
MNRLTAEWVRKAEADYRYARRSVPKAEPFHDQRCFHCQQAAEKYLKALLEELGVSIPRTHVLRDLLALLLPHHPSLRSLGRGLRFLTRFAVGTRYPGASATKRQTDAALRWAERVRHECRSILGLKPAKHRKKKR